MHRADSPTFPLSLLKDNSDIIFKIWVRFRMGGLVLFYAMREGYYIWLRCIGFILVAKEELRYLTSDIFHCAPKLMAILRSWNIVSRFFSLMVYFWERIPWKPSTRQSHLKELNLERHISALATIHQQTHLGWSMSGRRWGMSQMCFTEHREITAMLEKQRVVEV